MSLESEPGINIMVSWPVLIWMKRRFAELLLTVGISFSEYFVVMLKPGKTIRKHARFPNHDSIPEC